MILGVYGKGGSGKSTLATGLVRYLHTNGNTVLAVDADHNMDLTFNLTGEAAPDMVFLGSALPDVRHAIGLSEGDSYASAFLNERDAKFSLTPPDAFTKRYAHAVLPRLSIMSAGPQTDAVLYGQSCSHILTTPLKLYLPLLSLKEHELVVVDEKAGADGVTTGIVTGIDVAVIVCEPSPHSIKTARQIADLVAFYKTPFLFVGNKLHDEHDLATIESGLRANATASLQYDALVPHDIQDIETQWSESLGAIVTAARAKNKNDKRARTTHKFRAYHEHATPASTA